MERILHIFLFIIIAGILAGTVLLVKCFYDNSVDTNNKITYLYDFVKAIEKEYDLEVEINKP